MDITRMTQNGAWDGWICVQGRRINVSSDSIIGVRDRSWGIRQVGVPRNISAMLWLWAALQASDREILFHANELPNGDAVGRGAQIALLDGSEPEHMAEAFADIELRPGTREVAKATLHLVRRRGRGEIRVVMHPRRDRRLFLSGLGYGHPEWGLGFDKGELAIGYDHFTPASITVHAAPHLHQMWAQYEAQTEATVFFPDGQQLEARGTHRPDCGA
jgi:hypothetical protein